MNEIFVAVICTVTGSRVCGCFSKLRHDFSVPRWWQQMMNAIRWIEQFEGKKVCRAYLKEMEGQHTAMPPSMA